MTKQILLQQFTDRILTYMQQRYTQSSDFYVFPVNELLAGVGLPLPPGVKKSKLIKILPMFSKNQITAIVTKKDRKFIKQVQKYDCSQGYVLTFLWDWLIQQNPVQYAEENSRQNPPSTGTVTMEYLDHLFASLPPPNDTGTSTVPATSATTTTTTTTTTAIATKPVVETKKMGKNMKRRIARAVASANALESMTNEPLVGISALTNIPSYNMVKTDIFDDDDDEDEEEEEEDDEEEDVDDDDDDDDSIAKDDSTVIPSVIRSTTKPTPSLPSSLHDYFHRSSIPTKPHSTVIGAALVDGTNLKVVKESALLCKIDSNRTIDGRENIYGIGDYCRTKYGEASTDLYLNVHEPFCLATIGVQGGGKSHTMACVIENCLLSLPDSNIVNIQNPMSVLVLHYDQNIASVCEATGLIYPSPLLQKYVPNLVPSSSSASLGQFALPKEKMIVLVSPTYYQQRKAFYGDYCVVKPLLFKWNTLSADHIKRIMRIKETDNQLYMATLLSLLRNYQREAIIPSFTAFVTKLREMCNVKGQAGPLGQRLALLESIIKESTVNQDIIDEGADLLDCCQPGTLVIVDLTDPLLASDEANCIFQVLAEQYRTIPSFNGQVGKLLALDEAHKFMDGVRSDGLSESIVNIARLMRHDGIRLAVSTQSPTTLAPELLELVTVAVLHRFHSRDWFTYLGKKLPLTSVAWEALMNLEPGHALLFSSQNRINVLQDKTINLNRINSGGGGNSNGGGGYNEDNEEYDRGAHDDPTSSTTLLPLGLRLGKNFLHVHIRPRITADRGASRKNVTVPGGGGGGTNVSNV